MDFRSAQGRAGRWIVAVAMTAAVLIPASAQAAWLDPVQISSLEAEAPAASGPQVVVDEEGTATATWTVGAFESESGVVAARRPAGGPWDAAEQISNPSITDIYEHRLSIGPDGQVAAIWFATDDNVTVVQVASRTMDGVWGDAQTIATHAQTNPATGVDNVRIAAGPDGVLGAIWREDPPTGSDQIMSAFRPAPDEDWEEPQRVSELGTSRVVRIPEIAFDAAGDAVAVWTAFQAPNPGFSQLEFADRDAGAETWGPPAPMPGSTTESGGLIYWVDLSVNPDGGAAVAWWHDDQPDPWAVSAARRAPAGGAWDVDRVSAPGDSSTIVEIELDDSGDAVAAWIGADGEAIRSASAAAGADWSAPDTVRDVSVSSAIGMDGRPDGRAIITFASPTQVYSAERPADGAFVDEEVDSAENANPQVAYDPGGGAIATWASDGDVFAATQEPPPASENAIAYVHDNSEIRRVEPDATNDAAITAPDGPNDHRPEWSPNGGLLAFDSDRSGTQELWTIGPSDEEPVRIPGANDGVNQGMDPTWSPDGEDLAFTSFRDGRICPTCVFNTEIYRVPVTGGAAERLTNNAVLDSQPAWSPDGKTIAFVRQDLEGGDSDIWLMDADGSNQRAFIADGVQHDNHPAWSPDGKRLAWTRDDDGTDEVWIADADGTDAALATQGAEPAWSPDCTQLAVTRETPGDPPEPGEEGGSSDNLDVYVVPLDDGDDVQATTSPADDEAPTWRRSEPACDEELTVSIDDADVSEGDTATFDVRLSEPAPSPVTVKASTASGTATSGTDFSGKSADVSFATGEQTASFTVDTTEDSLDEPDEDFSVELSDPTSATIADGSATGGIADDDDPPPPPLSEVSIDDASADEGDEVTFTLSLDKPAAETVTVDVATADDTAVAGSDYTAASDTVTFAPGATTAEFSVQTTEDGADEPDETFDVTLSNPSNATVDDGEGIGTIVDDDEAAPTPQVSIADVTVTERDGVPVAATLKLTLDESPDAQVSVGFATADGTARQPADYKPAGGRVTFGAGDQEAEIPVAIEGDRLDEPSEHLVVRLSAPTGLTIADDEGRLTVTDNDAPPTADGFDAYALESSPGVVFAVELRRASGKPVTIEYRTVDHSASAPSDYVARTGTLTIPAGQTSGAINVKVVNDQVREADYERFTLDLGRSSVPLVAGELVGTIVDDEHGVAPAPVYPDDGGRRSTSAQRDAPLPGATGPIVPRLVIGAGVLRSAANGTVAVRVRCTQGGGDCRGRVRVRYRGRTLASSSIGVAAGETTTAKVRLSRAGRRLLRSRRRMRVQVEVTLGGVRSVRTTTLMRKGRSA